MGFLCDTLFIASRGTGCLPARLGFPLGCRRRGPGGGERGDRAGKPMLDIMYSGPAAWPLVLRLSYGAGRKGNALLMVLREACLWHCVFLRNFYLSIRFFAILYRNSYS